MKLPISDAYVDLVTEAHAYATARQEELKRDFALGRWGRWDWDQDTGQLVFADFEGGPPRVVCEIQFVGTISTVSDTWLWAWANPHLAPQVCRDVRDVRLLGEARGIPQLTEPKWEAEEVDGWEMTSIAAYVLRAKGVYRTRFENGFAFMVLTSVRWADGADGPGSVGGG